MTKTEHGTSPIGRFSTPGTRIGTPVIARVPHDQVETVSKNTNQKDMRQTVLELKRLVSRMVRLQISRQPACHVRLHVSSHTINWEERTIDASQTLSQRQHKVIVPRSTGYSEQLMLIVLLTICEHAFYNDCSIMCNFLIMFLKFSMSP